MIKIKNFRWWIIALLMVAILLNYFDRQSLPVVLSEIKKIIPIDTIQFSQLNFMFIFAYGLMYAIGGMIIDHLGTKRGMAIMILWWSIATILHGLVAGLTGLFIARFLLGLGEGGGFPGAAKAVSEWFPPKERSFAFGLFNTGSSIGAVIAPPLIATIVLAASWKWVFFIPGIAGLILTTLWILIYTTPEKCRFTTSEEKELLRKNSKHHLSENSDNVSIKWASLFNYRKLWGLLTIKLISDSAWYFLIFWLPKYLSDIRGLNIKEIGYYAWIPYAFAGVGSLTGGWLSSFLIKKGVSLDTSRKISLGIAAAFMPFSLLITSSPLNFAIVFFSMMMLGHQFWSTIVQTLAADIFPSKVVGSVAGLMGAIGCFGGMFFNLLAGQLIENIGYGPVFIFTGLLHPLAYITIFLIIRKIEPVRVS